MTRSAAQRRVYLHVGKHKTGTTSIQRYLFAHRDFLRAAGYRLLEHVDFNSDALAPRVEANCFNLSHLVIRPELMTPVRLNRPFFRMTRDMQIARIADANKRLHAIEGRHLVASAESFSFLRTSAERELLDRLFDGFDLRPVIFLRDQSTWLHSWQQQVGHFMERKEALALDTSTGSIFNFEPTSWLADDTALTDFFGPEAQSMSYEDALAANGSVVPAFLRAVGLDPDRCPEWEGYWFNKTAPQA